MKRNPKRVSSFLSFPTMMRIVGSARKSKGGKALTVFIHDEQRYISIPFDQIRELMGSNDTTLKAEVREYTKDEESSGG